jgi:hypothetical protein
MKSIAVLFFAITLVIAFIVASGVPHLNELQVIRPEKHAAARTAAGSIYVIGDSAERGTFRIFRLSYCADAAEPGAGLNS